jgi:crossover junction endodeoxyribonuclease RuvC
MGHVTGLVLGVDPDAFGALAFVNRETGALVDVLDMPVLDLKPMRLVDGAQLAGLLDEWATRIGEAYVERQWARPTDPPSYAFRVGHKYGTVLGVIRAHFIRLSLPSPQAWKKAMRVTSEKDSSRAEASIRFPTDCRRWALKKHHGRAEASLIAAYGRREILREGAAMGGHPEAA